MKEIKKSKVGRKKLPKHLIKKPVKFYLEEYLIEKHGGIDALREDCVRRYSQVNSKERFAAWRSF